MRSATFYSTAVAVVLLLPGLFVGPSLDAAVFTEVAARTHLGAVPYLAVWDHKPPGLYGVGALGQALAPWTNPWIVMWVIGAVFVIGAAILVAVALRRLGLRGGAVAGGMLAAAVPSVFLISLGGGLTEPTAGLPLAAGLLLALKDDRHARWRSVLTGAMLGLALLFSLVALPGVVAVGLLALAAPAGWAWRLRSAALIAAGALVPWLAVAGAFAVLGGGPALIDALITYSGAYRSTNHASLAGYSVAEAIVATLGLLVAVAPALVGGVAAWRRGSRWKAIAAASLVWLGATAALAFYLGRFEPHYASTLAVPLAMLGALGLSEAWSLWRRSRAAAAGLTVLFAAASTVSLAIVAASAWALAGPLQTENQRAEAVAAFVREHSPAGSSLFVWGDMPQLYYLADRVPASRFIYLIPLTTPGYTTPELVSQVRSELTRAAPTLVIDAGSPEPGALGLVPLLIPRPVRDYDGRGYDILSPLRAYIADHYVLLDVVEGWPVYQRRGG